MTAAGTLLSTAAGVGLIGLVGRDAFDALFHAEGRGMFSRQITRAVWQVFRRAGTRHVRLSLAGPVAFVTVLATWAGLLVLGWALVFWPHMPGSFRFDPDVEAAGSDFVHALNVSLVTLTTLGFGDITPTSEALRLILPLEALLGFGLLSASISWLVSIYPALSRRRSLAYEISLLRAAEAEDDLSLDALHARCRRAPAGRADVSAGRGRARPRPLPDLLLLLRRRTRDSRCRSPRRTCSRSPGAG